MRAYKTVNDSYIEPISFTVPRRAEVFQSDIYPPATGTRAAVTAAEWLSGKDGVPSKIDLESIYDGNAPVEVASDYKPPTPAPAPTPAKAPSPVKKEEPAPTQKAPPPSMAEQKGSIAAMASKFQDDEAANSDDDASSFEEVAKPVQRSVPKAEPKPLSPIKTSPTKTAPPKASPISQPTPARQAVASPTAKSAPGNTASSSDNSSVEASLAQIKNLLETQTRTITAQSEKISKLAIEVDTLKIKVGSGAQDQSERIRQLELELEEARS
jgi:coronin-1B/1C/6